jgi:glucose-6-phosphate 1-dehydrogenase
MPRCRPYALLAEANLVDRSRIIMEKPFGTDLKSAVALNAELHEVFSEDQIFRIDHFLGKEPAQNILAFRFANGLFEPIWNRNFIDHVQIDVPETLGLGMRVAFYEATGAYRDMVVTHLFQILAFMAMEPPTSLAPGPISEEKNKVFRSMLPIDPKHVVRGQYTGYRSEAGVDPESDTETFIALKCAIDNWRWAGVPFFLRTGKRLAEGQRIISIAFREPPKSMFPPGSGVSSQPQHSSSSTVAFMRVPASTCSMN